jgi:ATP-binding cassette subfamily B protein/subfamily B ATP-binding cassette protein MsbA
MTITPPTYVTQSEELYDKPLDVSVIRRLFGFIMPYKGRMILAMILMLGATFTIVAGPYFIKIAIDEGLTAGDATALRLAVLAYLAAAIMRWAFTYFRVIIMARVGQSVIYDLRKKLFDQLQKLSLGFYSRYSVGRVITRVINDVENLREFIIWTVLATVRDLFALIGIVAAMISLNLNLSLIVLATFPFMAIATYIYRRTARIAYRRVRAAVSWVNSVLAENINGIRVVQAFSRQNHNYESFRDYTNRYHLQTLISAARIAASFVPVADVLGGIATAAVIYLGGRAVLGREITAGVLVAFVLYIDRFFEPIKDLFRRFDTLQSTMASSERIFELMDSAIEVQDKPDAIALPRIKGDVRFENVSFHYADDPAPVLIDVELIAPAGSTVALVGETGAGKTTIARLLSRFYDPTSGSVRVDDYDLRDILQASLRSQMGIVLQDPFLFNGSVKENILFGRLNATDQEIESAAKAVGAHEFIVNLKNGYDTSVEEGGVMLSVGQRQLISFARALLADPRILILDEATSSVDTQTEQMIQSALAILLTGRTSFVIAHRLSTITNADKIVVVDGGRIIEQGTHAELIEKQGRYYELYKTGFQE